jgi:S-adenosylmethionine-diacylglycerol 3-amino-3-carboxypropyl transferase
VLRKGLQIQPGARVLSIASAGDNSLELLLDDPQKVICIDRNTTQLALIELKIAAIRQMEAAQVRLLLGLSKAPGSERDALYQELRPKLPPRCRKHWDEHLSQIHSGVANTGKFERYLATFRRFILPLVQWPSTVRQMCKLTDLDAQKTLYNKLWNSWRWRTLFRLFFSRRVMAKRGRQKEFFDQVEETQIADVFMGRAEKALTEIPAATNPYLRWILDEANLTPDYLSDEHMPTIRERLDRIEIIEDDLIDHLAQCEADTYDAFNLSDCLEYMPQEVADGLLENIVASASAGARLVYWNLLVPRDGSNIEGLVSHLEEAKTLHAIDRAFFYGRLVVEQVAASSPSELG